MKNERNPLTTVVQRNSNFIVQKVRIIPETVFVFYNPKNKNIALSRISPDVPFKTIEIDLVLENFLIIYNEHTDNDKVEDWKDLFVVTELKEE